MDRVIVVSPRKSGTHLVQRLMALLGFDIFGEPIPARRHRVAVSLRDRLILAQNFLDPEELTSFDLHGNAEGFVLATDRLIAQICWMWQVRLAARDLSNVELSRPDAAFKLKMKSDSWASPFTATPAGLCWIFHSIDVWKVDPQFWSEWTATGQPLLVLNYRDPRDALVSMVNFFSGESGHTFRRFPESAIFQPILESIPDISDRISYALSDPAMPLLADYEAAVSLFFHPEVCKVAFEDLVGPAGRGSREKQIAAVQQVASRAGVDSNVESIADALFDRRSFTFHKGQIGAWREVFTRRHEQQFRDRFGHLLEIFGYE